MSTYSLKFYGEISKIICELLQIPTFIRLISLVGFSTRLVTKQPVSLKRLGKSKIILVIETIKVLIRLCVWMSSLICAFVVPI